MSTEIIQELKKAIEAGSYNAAPSSLTQGSSLQKEDLSPVMNVTTAKEKAIKLQKMLSVVPHKSTFVQFNRQLDYGALGGSATLEGGIGIDKTSSYVRAGVPMAFYAHTRRVTEAAMQVQSFDGVNAQKRADEDAAKNLAFDVEFHLFRGHADYSNAGVFDGNQLAMAQDEAGMQGLDPQIRSSDFMSNTQDLIFNEYGADVSVVIDQRAILAEGTVEDVYARSQMRHGDIETIILDPLTLSSYNKTSISQKQRIVLAGSPQAMQGASIKEQAVAGSVLRIESSRFTSAKTNVPSQFAPGAPSAPSMGAPAIVAAAGTSFLLGEVYQYAVSAANQQGEGPMSAAQPATITANGDKVTIAITPAGGFRSLWFNVYRSAAGETRRYFIGRVAANGSAAVTFTDLNNRLPKAVTGFALDMSSSEIAELMPFTAFDLAQTDLSKIRASARFLCLLVKLPRFSQLIDNVLS
jgi:hypothetical protein